jgi:hypothetical protein
LLCWPLSVARPRPPRLPSHRPRADPKGFVGLKPNSVRSLFISEQTEPRAVILRLLGTPLCTSPSGQFSAQRRIVIRTVPSDALWQRVDCKKSLFPERTGSAQKSHLSARLRTGIVGTRGFRRVRILSLFFWHLLCSSPALALIEPLHEEFLFERVNNLRGGIHGNLEPANKRSEQ